jgi:hypothetical protein
MIVSLEAYFVHIPMVGPTVGADRLLTTLAKMLSSKDPELLQTDLAVFDDSSGKAKLIFGEKERSHHLPLYYDLYALVYVGCNNGMNAG